MMNDPATPNPASTNAPASDDSAAKGKSPLDALEELLKDAKDKGGAASPGQPAAPAPVKKEEGPSEEERLDKLAAQEALHKQQEQLEVQQELQKIKIEAAQSPQAHARMEQDQAKQEEQQSSQQSSKGFEIRQLKHSKV
jgi:hypothetical protein